MTKAPMTPEGHPNAGCWGYMSNPTTEGSRAIEARQARDAWLAIKARPDMTKAQKDDWLRKNRQSLARRWHAESAPDDDPTPPRQMTRAERSIAAERAVFEWMLGTYALGFILCAPFIAYWFLSIIFGWTP